MSDEPMTSGECAAAVQRVLDRDEGEWDQLGDIVARVTLDVDRRRFDEHSRRIDDLIGKIDAYLGENATHGVRFPRT